MSQSFEKGRFGSENGNRANFPIQIYSNFQNYPSNSNQLFDNDSISAPLLPAKMSTKIAIAMITVEWKSFFFSGQKKLHVSS